jgi:hypothetical protein
MDSFDERVAERYDEETAELAVRWRHRRRPSRCPRRSAASAARHRPVPGDGRNSEVNKAGITPALVSRLLAAQFPQWAHLPVAPIELDGWDNTTFRLGDELSVRLPSADA